MGIPQIQAIDLINNSWGSANKHSFYDEALANLINSGVTGGWCCQQNSVDGALAQEIH